jgi:hypothetical protein
MRIIDGKLHVKTMAEANKYMKPIKDKVVVEEISISAVDRLNRLEKKIIKLEKEITGMQTQMNNVVAKVILMEQKLRYGKNYIEGE